MTRKSVPRIGRVLDVVGLLFFLVGAGFLLWAWIGLWDVPAFVPDPGGEPWAAMRMADGYVRLQKIGGGFMCVGIGVFVAAWWIARRRPPEPPTG